MRPRDNDAQVVALTPADVATYLSQSTLDRYPRVGVVIGGSSDGTVHEWDMYQSGVFTHEVISALRGGADVNGDRRIEYTELSAFLAAANREVQDPRARLRAIVKAPVIAPRTPIANLAVGHETGRLVEIPAAAESFFVEDARGNRLVDGRPEPGFLMSIYLPLDQPLFVRRGDQEAEFVLKRGVDRQFGSLAFRGRPLRSRGAVDSALRAGLFLTQFGPAYYRGFVDRQDVIAVPIAPSLGLFQDSHTGTPPAGRKSFLRSSLGGASAALFASSVVFGSMSWSASRENQDAVQRDSADAVNRFRVYTALTAGFLVSSAAFAVAALFVGKEP